LRKGKFETAAGREQNVQGEEQFPPYNLPSLPGQENHTDYPILTTPILMIQYWPVP